MPLIRAHQISEIKNDIEKFNRQGETMDMQRKKVMRELEEQLNSSESQANAFQVCSIAIVPILAADPLMFHRISTMAPTPRSSS